MKAPATSRRALFDVRALYRDLDDERERRGLSWPQMAREVGVAASTLTGMSTRRAIEGDGVLQMLRWLGRSPESFVPGDAAPEADVALPPVGPGDTLRFDARALHAALSATRVERGLSWRQVADEIGAVEPASLTRLARGGRLSFPSVMSIVRWLGRPARDFTRACNW